MPHDLRTFIALLEQECQLSRVTAEVNPKLEIAAITDRICKDPDGGKALLFLKPKGARFAVATNLFGSCKRVCLAFGIENLAQLTTRMTSLLTTLSPLDFKALDNEISELAQFNMFTPLPAEPLWQKDTTSITLFDFPFLQSWEQDGSKSGKPLYITLGQVFTTFPDGSSPNCGLYRAQVIGPKQLAIRWKEDSGAALHLTQYRKQCKRMPVAIALGGDPALILSAMMPLPGKLDEITFAGFLRNSPLKISPCFTIPLQVPSSAEVVLEGFVDPSETFDEGPFGNHTGYYVPAGSASVMHITSINIRPQAIIPATIVGPPPMEDCWMATAWEKILQAFLQKLRPEIHSIHIPVEWSFHQSAIISLESTTPGMVSEISAFLWELPWFAHSRILVFVSSQIPVEQTASVCWKAINELDMHRTMIVNRNGNSIALDATGVGSNKVVVTQNQLITKQVANRWQEYGFA